MDRTPNSPQKQAGKLAVAGDTDAASQDALDWDQPCLGAPLLKPGDFQEPLPMSDRELFGFEDVGTNINSNYDFEPRHQIIS
jgi:hypothetical protein